MKVPGAALALLLCAAAPCSQVSSAPLGSDTPTACCFSYASRQVPRRLIANYFETSSQCSKAGIIFLTKRSRQVCADPREAWVQEYVMDLELNARVARKL
ncbi:C-C motif chemokine 3-like isoform X2 [Sturnira hondurensis]|uniref:C-C motif chemokine 3-like isoform X2 n=1 Tax=Sturnira hondurensis TaxID=192404 RepID=UPI0018796D14|nr:C-C motif chemokine 3-like isoform X2 [Sturnira hondurensis]